MNHAILIARREIVDRRNVYLGAAVLSVVPFIYQLFPNARRFPIGEASSVTAVLLAYIFAMAIAVITGATMIGRDLSERRLGFYLARPISASALWFGKLIGTAVVVTLGFVIVVLPSLAVNGLQWPSAWRFDQSIAFPIALVFFVILAAHAVSTLLRSRSAWVAFDAAALVAVAALWWWGVSRLLRVWVGDVVFSIMGITAAALFLTLGVAGVVQIRAGRTDARRSHRALSIFTWSVLGALAVGVAAYSAWFLSPGVEDLRYVGHAMEVPKSDWVVVQGPVEGRGRDYSPVFLKNTRDGRSLLVAGATGFERPLVSSDGRFVVVPSVHAPYGRRGEDRLVVVNLGSGEPAIRDIAVASTDSSQLTLSPDGRLLFVPGQSQFQAFSLPDGKLVMSGRGRYMNSKPVFVTPLTVRMYHAVDDGTAITDVDLKLRSMAKVGHLSPGAVEVRPAGDGSRLIGVKKLGAGLRDNELILCDGKSGAPIRSIAKNVSSTARFLPDGRLALFNENSSSLELYDRDGNLITKWTYSGQVAYPRALSNDGTKLLATIREDSDNWRTADTLVIDLTSLREVKRIADVIPASYPYSAAIQPAGSLAYDQSRSLWRIDWKTGAKTLVMKGHFGGSGVAD